MAVIRSKGVTGRKPSITSPTRTRGIDNPKKILKIFCYTAIAKPLNGSIGKSKGSYLLKLAPIPYTYTDKKKILSSSTVDAYMIKGVRGAIRHKVMDLCHDAGLDVCHTSDKDKDKDKNNLIPDGFHPLGACANNSDSCIIHQIFGSKGVESKIAVFSHPIVRFQQKSAVFPDGVQAVHIATENRNCMSFDGKPLQDFQESYFSGEFSFEIDVTKLDPIQLGLIVNASCHIEKIGRGFNVGYSKIKVIKIQLLHRVVDRSLEWQDDSFQVVETVEEHFLKDEVLEAMKEWQEYLDETSFERHDPDSISD
ncbi:MAG: hypothetical protein ACTSRU_01115 [Candidatus Hodarchaeales archaeon]